MPATANQRLYERSLHNHVQLLRFGEGAADRVLKLLAETERELLEKITGAFAAGRSATRLEEMLRSVKRLRAEAFALAGNGLQVELNELALAQAQAEDLSLRSVGVQLNTAAIPLEQAAAAASSPINGLKLERWLDGILEAESTKLQQAVSLAFTQGETVEDLARRIRGTKANSYADGILSVSRRNAQALARTAVGHVATQARETVWEANKDIVRALRWTSTLDGRTSSVCQARDGHLSPVGDSKLDPSEQPLAPAGARPPAHFNCRSVMVAVLDGVELAGDRPFVADERTRAKREAAFRAEAKKRDVPIQQIRKEWAEKRVGIVPSDTTYASWLGKQTEAFQNDVLGPERATLFRSGVPLERFVDASGRRLNLEELRLELGL